MDFLTGWRAVRHYAIWLAMFGVVGFAIGVVLPRPVLNGRPATIAQVASGKWGRFTVSSVIGVPPTTNEAERADHLTQAQFYAQSSEVLDAAATQLTLPAGSTILSRILSVRSRPSLGQLIVTGSGTTPAQAAQVSTAFGTALEGKLAAIAQAAATARVAAAQKNADVLKAQLDGLNANIAALPSNTKLNDPDVIVLRSRAQATLSAYNAAFANLTLVQNSASSDTQSLVVTLQAARPQDASYSQASRPLTDRRWLRGILGVLGGVGLVVVLVLIAEARRPRVRTRSAAEHAFGAPVLAEAPRLRARTREAAVVVAPNSRSAEAYRALRTILLSPVEGPPAPPAGGARVVAAELNGSAPQAISARTGARGVRHAPVRAVTQKASADPEISFRWWRAPIVLLARPNEETSLPTVATNVAAAIAETGRRVVVVRTTVRRVGAGGDESLPTPKNTNVPNVSEVEVDLQRLTQMAATAYIRRLAAGADAVLIVSGSVLAEHATTVLGSLADVVVIAADVGSTTVADARATTHLLRRLDLPFRGIVLSRLAPGDLVGRKRGLGSLSWWKEGVRA